MNDGEKIISNLMNQADYLYSRGLEPSRVILGEKIVSILKAHCLDKIIINKPIDNKECLFMGLPVTIDCQRKWILMVCVGDECDGKYWLEDK